MDETWHLQRVTRHDAERRDLEGYGGDVVVTIARRGARLTSDKGALQGLPAEGVGRDLGSAAGEGFPLIPDHSLGPLPEPPK